MGLTFLLTLLGTAVISVWASWKVKSTFQRFSGVGIRSGFTGAQVARSILDRNGLQEVPVERAGGILSDHYDPFKKVLRLSPQVYGEATVAAVGVAAHEAGHALQHQRHYAPLVLRNFVAPAAAFSSNLSMWLILAGFLTGAFGLAKLGVMLFGVGVVFTLITLPVEFDASARAKVVLADYGLVTAGEGEGVRQVLSAAAMTYVAAAVTSVMWLLYYAMQLGLLGGGDE